MKETFPYMVIWKKVRLLQEDETKKVKDALHNLPQLGSRGAHLNQQMNDLLVRHKQYISEEGQDLPEVLNWQWHTPDAE